MKRTPFAPRTKPMKRGDKPLKNTSLRREFVADSANPLYEDRPVNDGLAEWHEKFERAMHNLLKPKVAPGGTRPFVKTWPTMGKPIEPRRAGPEFRYAEPQVAALFRPAPKDKPLQHTGYMAIVRTLPCAYCGIRGFTQFCHADIIGAGGKGKGIKSDCRLGWPGCGPHFDGYDTVPGCHWNVGTSGKMTKSERHEFEAQAGERTRKEVRRIGKWPKDLPQWEEAHPARSNAGTT